MNSAGSRTIPLWDVPTRLAHWLIAVLVPFSWWTATHDHLPWHRLSGYAIVGLLLFRLAWGFAGGEAARFKTFLRGPATVLAYTRGRGAAYLGHNPLGGWSVAAMLAVLVLQVSLGLFSVDEDGLQPGPLARFVSFDTGRIIARIHHLNFFLLAALIALHLGAIGVYEWRGRRLVAAMITGRAQGEVAPRRPSWLAFLLVAAAAAAGAWFIAHGLRLHTGQRP